jgi:putative ABC transport system permease protein
MWKNYLKITLRNLIRQKGYSFINISGLALGLACCILIFLWVADELGFDRFHANSKNLFQAGIHYDQGGGNQETVSSSPGLLAQALKQEFPEIRDTARSSFPIKMSLAYKNKIFNESLHFVSPSFLKLFTFPLLEGKAETAMSNPHAILLTQDMAQKYFGNESPMGKTLLLNNRFSMMVTGILKNPPENSSIRFDGLIPFECLKDLGANPEVWNSNDYITYVLLNKNANLKEVNRKISGRQHREIPQWKSDIFLFPLVKIHLYSFNGKQNRIGSIYTFGIIGFLILLIACINFMNLTTARSVRRAKEIGLRKVFGVKRKNIMLQFYGESLIMVVLGLLLALLLAELALPAFNLISAKDLSLNLLHHWYFIPSLILMIVVTTLLSGSYPALVLSSFKPITVIQKIPRQGAGKSGFRQFLVVFQFSLSVILFISTMMVYRQLGFMQSKDLGFNKDNVLSVKANPAMFDQYESLKNQLLSNPNIKNVSTSYTLPSEAGYWDSTWQWEGKDPGKDVSINKTWVGYDYDKTLGIELVEGRFFSRDFPGEEKSATVINQNLAQLLGKGSALGKVISRDDGDRKTVIGVVKDYHYLPVSRQIGNLMLHLSIEPFRYIFIKVSPGNIARTMDFTRETFQTIFPGSPFEFSFLDESYDRYYRSEIQLGRLLNGFTILAIFISCLGLFGLASFMAEQRTREIGIRKVLGSTIKGITVLLSREFLKWVLLANLIAWPVAYFLMKSWLQNFPYRTPITFWIFLIATLGSLAIAWLTISYQSLKAATANPVKALRYE